MKREVPELEKDYLDASLFSELPAYDLYFRHGTGLKVDRGSS